MNEAEKERLIKKDIAMIENKVRHAFNQGYEMGLKESRSEIPNTCSDAISRKYILDLIDTKGANLDDDLLIVAQWIQDAPSVNPHPIECGDAISRQEALNAITMAEVRWQAVDNVNKLPSVSPQQRTGHWIEKAEDYYKAINEYGGGVDENTDYFTDDIACPKCLSKFSTIDNETERFRHCPKCGAKMEVEE